MQNLSETYEKIKKYYICLVVRFSNFKLNMPGNNRIFNWLYKPKIVQPV